MKELVLLDTRHNSCLVIADTSDMMSATSAVQLSQDFIKIKDEGRFLISHINPLIKTKAASLICWHTYKKKIVIIQVNARFV